jgi:hypothetical protein
MTRLSEFLPPTEKQPPADTMGSYSFDRDQASMDGRYELAAVEGLWQSLP